jgi:ribosomal-protein-alanine N-acetyltransferase
MFAILISSMDFGGTVSDDVVGRVSLRALREDDLPMMFEIQLDDTAQQLAAFTDKTARDRDAYLQKFRRILADDAIVTRVVEVDGEAVGSVAAFPIEGDTEVTYWIRRDRWGRGVATAALAALLDEVTVRPVYGRIAEDNVGSALVLERNGFIRVGSEKAFAEARQTTITELVFRLSE